MMFPHITKHASSALLDWMVYGSAGIMIQGQWLHNSCLKVNGPFKLKDFQIEEVTLLSFETLCLDPLYLSSLGPLFLPV